MPRFRRRLDCRSRTPQLRPHRRHGKDPLAYFKDVLARLPRLTNQDDLRQLTSRLWQPTSS